MSRKRFLGLSHYLVLAIVLVSLLTLLVPVSEVKADSVVVFPDPNLERAIRGARSGPMLTGDIHQSDLDKLTKIGFTSDDIVDLTGMEHCSNLTELRLVDNRISDLSPLSGLTGLTGLWLPTNQISDLSPLSGLTNLTLLHLGFNRISNLSPLSGLTNLITLVVYNNQISNLSPLSGLTNLEYLGLENNQISDITPLVNNPGLGQGDDVHLRGNPLNCHSINTLIPALIAEGVSVDWDAGAVTIGGHIEDGYGRRLGGVEVTLIAMSSGSPTTQEVTIADDDGQYSFGASPNTVQPGTYVIEVALECHKAVGDTATFSVNHDTGPSVRAQTDTFDFDGTCGQGVKDIDFVDPYVHPTTATPADRLDDLAAMYYHVKQVVDFEWNELAFTPDLNLPIVVHGYVSDDPSTVDYDESRKVFYRDGDDVYIGATRSDYAGFKMSREWHEMFHELMDDTVGIPPLHSKDASHTGDSNHGGYANDCTGDSWVEGWAEFWPCALARSLGVPGWYLYRGTTSLELNWQVWDIDAGGSEEEFAVASLLVDLVDPVNPTDVDQIMMTNAQLWAIIGSSQLSDMSGVYAALVAANVGQLDVDTDNTTDLDELFIAHGFFADDGNRYRDEGEVVGLGGKPGRPDTLEIPNANLRIIVADSQGHPVSSVTLLVDVVFDSPLDIYNYSYEVDLLGSDGLVYFQVAPHRYDALMKMRVKDGSGTLSDELIVSNSVYWDRVSEATEGYAAEHTFVVGAEGKTTVVGAPAIDSGGTPVWIWPVVVLAVIAAGVGGFFLFFLLPRRKAKKAD